jgi:signal peptide peptidase-like 3
LLSSLSLVTLWILTGHWIMIDVLGIGFCVMFIAIVRLPSLKVSTLLLVGLVIYDVFWVYFSHLFFSSNVMIKVASNEANNPVSNCYAYN